MSLLISNSHISHKQHLYTLYVEDNPKALITNATFRSDCFTIVGSAESAPIRNVMFHDCLIIAPDMTAFKNCYFDSSCSMSVTSIVAGLNGNRIAK